MPLDEKGLPEFSDPRFLIFMKVGHSSVCLLKSKLNRF